VKRVIGAKKRVKLIFKFISIILVSAVFALSYAVTSYAASLGVQPLFLEVRPNQSGALRVTNSADVPVSVELMVYKRVVDESGVQTRVPADDDFIIFPPQGVLKPSSVQVFRLQSILTDLSKSESYYITVRQVPVDFKDIPGGGTQIQVVFAFDAAVHVIPNGAQADPQVISSGMGQTTVEVPTGEFDNSNEGAPQEILKEEEVPALTVKLRNDGTKYMYLQDLEYVASGTKPDGDEAKFPSWTRDEIIDAVKVVLVAPGATRNIKLPLPAGFNVNNVSVRVKERSGL